MGGIRRDIATLGETWNDTILWYAKAVAELDRLPISNRTSWRFLAAIHGFYEPGWVNAGVLTTGEKVPTELVDGTFGSQCQHGSWYFLPWHRGYLAAFEKIIADTIKKLGGPDDWTLPYWNYLDTNNADARKIPEAFLLKSLPDGTVNPLNKPPRRPTTVLKPPRPDLTDINLSAMNEPDFVVGANDMIGFGGTSIASGDLEFNPHNSVHVFIGGFLGDPDYAGLDPIFWLHHCNIDRLWEAWMQTPGRTMVQAAQWKEGPILPRFIMPAAKAGDADLKFVPRDTLKGGKLYPVYDDLTAGTGVTPGPVGPVGVAMGSFRVQSVVVLGASASPVVVTGDPVRTTVQLDASPTDAAVKGMGPIEIGKKVERLYLQLENVKGEAPSAIVDVFVNLPVGADPEDHPENRAESLYLFGLARASSPDGTHAGNGLGLSIDITELAGRLNAAGTFDPNQIDVSIFPVEGSSQNSPVTVERVSVLRRTVTAKK